MGFNFSGVFIESPQQSERELEQLFGGYARSITAPFEGVVLSFRDDLEFEDNQKYVLKKSRAIPNSRVAFINYVTFGGMLDYVEGFACQNGNLIENSVRDTETEGYADFDELGSIGNGILVSTLEFVGATSPSSNFPPFERGYFPNT